MSFDLLKLIAGMKFGTLTNLSLFDFFGTDFKNENGYKMSKS